MAGTTETSPESPERETGSGELDSDSEESGVTDTPDNIGAQAAKEDTKQTISDNAHSLLNFVEHAQ
jgi:hypothetical protein